MYIITIKRAGRLVTFHSGCKTFASALRHANCKAQRDGGEVVAVYPEGTVA